MKRLELTLGCALSLVSLASCGGEAPRAVLPDPWPADASAVAPSPTVGSTLPESAAQAAAPIAPAAAQAMQRRQEAPAELVRDGDGETAVTPPLQARVERMHVRPGDVVTAGMPLVTLILPGAAVEAARALGASEQLAVLEPRRAVVATLLDEGLTRAGELAELDARLATVRAERELSLAILKGAGLGSPAAVRGAGGRHIVRAPADGVVTEAAGVLGEIRGPEDGPVVRLSAGSARRVVARWASPPSRGTPVLLLSDGTRRELRFVSTAPERGGAAVAVWYDVVGEPLPATTRGRVSIEDSL